MTGEDIEVKQEWAVEEEFGIDIPLYVAVLINYVACIVTWQVPVAP